MKGATKHKWKLNTCMEDKTRTYLEDNTYEWEHKNATEHKQKWKLKTDMEAKASMKDNIGHGIHIRDMNIDGTSITYWSDNWNNLSYVDANIQTWKKKTDMENTTCKH